MASYGHWDRVTNQTRDDVLAVLKTSANSLASRYSPVVQCTRSWDSSAPTFEVIIDNVSAPQAPIRPTPSPSFSQSH